MSYTLKGVQLCGFGLNWEEQEEYDFSEDELYVLNYLDSDVDNYIGVYKMMTPADNTVQFGKESYNAEDYQKYIKALRKLDDLGAVEEFGDCNYRMIGSGHRVCETLREQGAFG